MAETSLACADELGRKFHIDVLGNFNVKVKMTRESSLLKLVFSPKSLNL